jgi:hypothetical protein
MDRKAFDSAQACNGRCGINFPRARSQCEKYQPNISLLSESSTPSSSFVGALMFVGCQRLPARTTGVSDPSQHTQLEPLVLHIEDLISQLMLQSRTEDCELRVTL